MSKSRRKIPTFKVSVMPDADYSQILHIPEVKEAVMDEVVIAIKEGVSNKKKSISLFSLANSEYYIELEKPQWNASLQQALNYYESEENYTKCIECRELLKKLSYDTTTR
jgi:hypothetical protein